MRTYILQDIITVRGKGGTTVTQSEADWLDLEGYQDIIVWVELREVTPAVGGGTLTLSVQTSPTKDEIFFGVASPPMSVNIAAAGTVMGAQPPTKVTMASATVPLARFLRWQLTSATDPFDATFRIVIAANAPGM